MSRRKLLNMIEQSETGLPDNKQFTHDVMSCVERSNPRHKGSKWYKPSSLNCMRNMYFTRIGMDQDPQSEDYQSIGMADTGTKRHESIQQVLMNMTDMGYDWKYISVPDYLAMKQKDGKCNGIQIKGVHGLETALFDSTLLTSFRCDGIVQRLSSGEYYLFEFKNVISFKYDKINSVLDQHKKQVTCYCTSLDLDKALVLYENRDVCMLDCPEVLKITQSDKNKMIDYLLVCESYVEKLKAPVKTPNQNYCRWCPYKTACRKEG